MSNCGFTKGFGYHLKPAISVHLEALETSCEFNPDIYSLFKLMWQTKQAVAYFKSALWVITY